MTTEAFVGSIFLERGNGGAPEVFTRVCQVFSLSGIGVSNDLVEATTFCSAGSKEYIGGLADGQEISVEANYEQGNTALLAMIDDVENRVTRNYRVSIEDDSPSETISFAALAMGWELNPSVDDRNTITYTLKISGAITIT